MYCSALISSRFDVHRTSRPGMAVQSKAGNGNLAIDVGEKVSGSVLTCNLGATVHDNTGVR